MKVKLVLEVSEKMAKSVSENSIERVINTTLRILDDVEHEDRHVNEEDWKESKRTVIDLWLKLQDALFRIHNKLPEQE